MQFQPTQRRHGALRPCALALATAAFACAANAATFTVTTLSDTGAGSLRDAIDQANRNSGTDTVNFAAGVNGSIVLASGVIEVFDSLTLNGPGAARLSLSGNQASRILRIHRAARAPEILDVSIAGLSFVNGSTSDEGGAIFVDDANLSVTDCAFRDNVAQRGGGLYAFPNGSTTLTLRRTRFDNNSANTDGGGFGAQDIDNVVLDTVSAVGNSAGKNGGGGFLRGVSVAVTNSEFRNNSDSTLPPGIGGVSGGAALRIVGSKSTATMSVADSRFIGNTSQRGQGGALWLSALPPATLPVVATATLQRLQLSDNRAELGGGGILGDSINASVSASSLVDNTAEQNGGGLSWQNAGSLLLSNVTLSGNQSILAAGGGVYSATATTLSIGSSTIVGNSAASGGGIRRDGAAAPLANSVVANNSAATAPDLSGAFAPNYTLIKDTSGASLSPGSGNLAGGTDPLLGNLDMYGGPSLSLLPAAASPLLNAGDPAGAGLPATDQRGLARVAAGRVDIGAVERWSPEDLIFRNGLQQAPTR